MKINIDRIRYEMARRKWNYSRLSKELGVTRQGLYYMLHTKPTITRVERIGKVLDTHFMDLIIVLDAREETTKAA